MTRTNAPRQLNTSSRTIGVLSLLVLFTVSGCGASTKAPFSSPSHLATTLPAPSTRVVGLVALGHSGLTGYGTDPVGSRALANSWATGANPSVDSIYQRLLAIEPEIAEHVANAAIPGSKANALEDEAIQGLSDVPHPQLVIIETIDNDITCDGSDPANYQPFAELVREAMNNIVSLSPHTRILILSDLGTPAGRAAALAMNPIAKAAHIGTGMCDLFDAAGTLQQANVTRLSTIIQGYEHALAATCAQVPQCTTDNGAMSGFDYRVSDFLPSDWSHLTVSGQARVAALMWPAVARVLGLKPA